MKQCASGFNFKSDQRAEKRKEVSDLVVLLNNVVIHCHSGNNLVNYDVLLSMCLSISINWRRRCMQKKLR